MVKDVEMRDGSAGSCGKSKEIVEAQRTYYMEGKTRALPARIDALNRLEQSILTYEQELYQALRSDLGKSRAESYMCEVGLTLSELRYVRRHVKRWSRNRRVHTPLAQFHATSFTVQEPYGVVLIMSPWNYPVLLTLEPLIGALAAGNCCVLKPSAYSPATSAVMAKLIREAFPSDYVTVIEGGRKENEDLLNQKFDYIFFTGGVNVGKLVMEKASTHLTPVTLELGGKSPCIVDHTANIPLTARRIVFGKYLNCGQTCVAPDYIYCDKEVKDELIRQILKQIKKQFGSTPLNNKNYGKIINEKHFTRIHNLIDPNKVVCGGDSNPGTLQIAPTVMDHVTFQDAVMQEEIFGPVLPVLTYDSLDEAIVNINSMAHPLALYIFTSNKEVAEKVTSHCGFGGGCVNDTIIHLATSEMGFGGFGESGMGSYHGKDGFNTFSHYKSIVDKKTWLDLPMRYQPYRKIYEKLLRKFLK